MTVEIGGKAPSFSLPAESWESRVSLEEHLAGGPVALFFYPGDWSSVCTDQMEVIEDHLPEFERRGVSVLAVSVDSPWSHAAWAHSRELTIPLLSDFDREVSKAYGVLRDEGFADRAYFLIDRSGTVVCRRIEGSPSDSPEMESVLRDLDRLG